MDSKEYKEASARLARKVLAAYGKEPGLYDDLEEQILSAFLLGTHRAFSMKDAGVEEWQSKVAMLELLHEEMGFPMEMAGNAMEYLLECLENKTQPLYGIMECGATGYGLLDQPKELGRSLREIVAVLGQRLEQTDP